MSSTATQTYQQGIQSLQAWIDFLDSEDAKLQMQLAKMQGDKSLPEIDADLPNAEVLNTSVAPSASEAVDDDWL